MPGFSNAYNYVINNQSDTDLCYRAFPGSHYGTAPKKTTITAPFDYAVPDGGGYGPGLQLWRPNNQSPCGQKYTFPDSCYISSARCRKDYGSISCDQLDTCYYKSKLNYLPMSLFSYSIPKNASGYWTFYDGAEDKQPTLTITNR